MFAWITDNMKLENLPLAMSSLTHTQCESKQKPGHIWNEECEKWHKKFAQTNKHILHTNILARNAMKVFQNVSIVLFLEYQIWSNKKLLSICFHVHMYVCMLSNDNNINVAKSFIHTIPHYRQSVVHRSSGPIKISKLLLSVEKVAYSACSRHRQCNAVDGRTKKIKRKSRKHTLSDDTKPDVYVCK